jgi:hypothetical protein
MHISRSLNRTRFRAKHRLPQALRVLFACPRSKPRSARAVRPSAASSPSHQPGLKKIESNYPSSSCFRSKYQASGRSHRVTRRAPVHSLGSNLQLRVYFKPQSGASSSQPWYASPSNFKATLPHRERGLTLPSSGPAYGGPLKSNVRPHKNHLRNTKRENSQCQPRSTSRG